MRKKCYLVTILLMISFIFAFSACKKTELNEDKIIGYKLDISFVSGLCAEISDAASLGIAREKFQHTNVAFGKENNVVYAQQSTHKNYLIKSKDKADGELSKVTFFLNDKEDGEIFDSNGNQIEENSTVTQDQIYAQINKLYVMKDYTFIQYTILVENAGWIEYEDSEGNTKTGYVDLRPLDENLELDEDGIPLFDKVNYITDDLHQSFVIHNQSGAIYSLLEFGIKEISNDLFFLTGSNYIYDMEINQDNELVFTSLLQNDSVKLLNWFKDEFNNIYIQTDLDIAASSNNKTVFYTQSKQEYFKAECGTVIYRNGDSGYKKVIGNEFQIGSVSEDSQYYVKGMYGPLKDALLGEKQCLTIIKEGKAVYVRPQPHGAYYGAENFLNGETLFVRELRKGLNSEVHYIFDININTLVYYAPGTSLPEATKLYYYSFDLNDIYDDEIWQTQQVDGFVKEITHNDMTLLEEGLSFVTINGKQAIQKVTAQKTETYEIRYDEDNKPYLHKTENKIADETVVLILQPML